MYFFRKLFGLFFIGLLIFGLFGVVGRSSRANYQQAYRQGYSDGQQSAESAAAASPDSESAPKAAPDGVPGAHVFYRGHGFFFPGFGLFFWLIPLFFLGLLFLGKGKRYRHGGRGKNWRGGPCGPRNWDQRRGQKDEPQEKSPEDIDDGPHPDEPIYRA